MNDTAHGREIFFEITKLDANLRVCAIDSVSGLEVVTVLPASTPEKAAQDIALKKLLWRLEKETQTDEQGDTAPRRPPGKYI